MPSSNPKAKARATARDRQSRSRNTTPAPSVTSDVKSESRRRNLGRSVSPYLQTSLVQSATRARLSSTPLLDLFDPHSSAGIPSSSSLNVISNSIKTQILSVIEGRDHACDQMMRELASRKKERIERDRIRDLEQAKRLEQERRQKSRKTTNKAGLPNVPGQDRPMAVGAHGVARQDGGSDRRGTSCVDSFGPTDQVDTSPMSSVASRAPSASDPNPKEPGTPNSEDAPHQPPPAATIQQYQVFGEDPSTFPDPTIYEIRPVTDDMTEEEKKEIYGVAGYPPSDLYDLTAGVPPDRDFSSAKPASQISASTFQNFVEPYLKPLTQEDIAFLMERGDRSNIFHIPRRGRSYKENWAEEDGTMVLDEDFLKLPPNEARGGIELMNDDMAETDNISTGPTAARWLSLVQPVTRFAQDAQSAVNGASLNDMDVDSENGGEPRVEPQQAATTFPESTWRNVPHQPPAPDYSSLDARLIEELRYAGFLSAADSQKLPDYNDVADDEVTARLRYLQRELRRVSILNGARKARVLEIATERMAVQEWQGIADDLDGQLNQAYMKRTRAGSKPKKQVKRPGAPAGGGVAGVARPGGGVGEPIRSLMERRQQWNDLIGPVVSHGQINIPKTTIFDKESMERLKKAEHENWVDEDDIAAD
jgi:transcriptional adapter 3